MSHEIASKVRHTDPVFAGKCESRAETFTALLRETRNLRGLLGDGGPAATEAAIVATRAQRLAGVGVADDRLLRQVGRLFDRIDTRVTNVIERGARNRLYFLREKLPHLADQSRGLVQPTAARYTPINSPVQTNLIEIARTRLRPPPEQRPAPEDAARSRLDFEEAITHRPTPRGVSLGGPSL